MGLVTPSRHVRNPQPIDDVVPPRITIDSCTSATVKTTLTFRCKANIDDDLSWALRTRCIETE